MPKLIYATQFVLDTLLTLYTALLLLRFLLQTVRANFYNPLCQFVVKMTDRLVLPLRRFVPGFFGLDWATLFLVLIVSLLNQILLVWLSPLTMHSYTGLFLITLGDVFRITYYIYFFSIIALMLASWFSPQAPNPMLQPLSQLVNPLIAYIRRFVKPVSGFDLSYFVFMLGIVVIDMLIIEPMMDLGVALLQ